MPRGRVVYPEDGSQPRYLLNGREVTKKQWDKAFPSKFDSEGIHASYIIDRDGRWALENGGRGHEMPDLSNKASKPVYFQSRGDLERYCQARGLKTSTDWSNLADTSKHKQAQPWNLPEPDLD